MTNKERFIELLRSTKREGIEKLIDFLEKTDFFTAPASTRFHSSYEGGLLQHSLNVYDCLAGLGTTTGDVQEFQTAGMRLDSIPQESIIIVALLHDLCKVNFYATEMRWRNADEFSDMHDLNGKMMPVQVDSNEQIEREKRFNQHMDGIYKNQKLIYVAATDYGPMPKQGSLIQFDKRPYKVADAISEDGIYSITLEANRA